MRLALQLIPGRFRFFQIPQTGSNTYDSGYLLPVMLK
jgi:hypothetical protein